MHDNSPYPLKGVDHLSATAIRDYSNCEALGAYRRNFLGVPQVLLGVYFAFGIVVHKINEMMTRHFWSIVSKERREVTKPELQKWLNFSRVFIVNVLEEKWGARGKNEPIIPLSWMTSSRRASMSPEDYQQEVLQKKSEFIGKMINAVASVGIEFTEKVPYSDMKFEEEFSSRGILLGMPLANFPAVKIDGQIDRIQFYPDGSYEVIDYKSGSIFEKYDRSYLVEDVQMSIYDYVGNELFGYQPAGLYIQGLNITTADRKLYGAQVLGQRKYRKTVPKRVQAHYDDLALLAVDIAQMIEMVVNRHNYSETERFEWEPDSSYARKAGLSESVRDGYFKPRVGEWCRSCPYLGLCPTDHPQDWANAAYAPELLTELPEPQVVTVGAPVGNQLALFDRVAKRTPNRTKRKGEIRDALVVSGEFVPLKTLSKNKKRSTITGLLPFVNKLRDLMLEHGTCPCVDSKLLPWFIVTNFVDLYRGQISLVELLSHCPYDACPRKCKEEKT